jgi:hypothetical protein
LKRTVKSDFVRNNLVRILPYVWRLKQQVSLSLSKTNLKSFTFNSILKAFRFSENLADLFFLLLRHKFSSIAYVRLVNFNAEKRKKKEQEIRKPRRFEYIRVH